MVIIFFVLVIMLALALVFVVISRDIDVVVSCDDSDPGLDPSWIYSKIKNLCMFLINRGD